MTKPKMIICKNCHELKPLFAKELCQSCYKKQNVKICKECKELKPHHSFGLCRNCCAKRKPLVTCKKCGELKKHYAKGLCRNCYDELRGLHKPMSKNKSCPSHLGVFINEQLLSKIFKNVKQMPNGNPGFDFVCNKGMKVDAKSSVTRTRGKCKTNSWHFQINKNTIADYFFCVAYDNRKDLNPLHMWLIPGKDVNGKTGIQISESKLHKWSQYEQPIDKALLCCNEMKDD